MEDQLKEIQSKLESIEKKQSAPWVMPVLLIVMTALATYINYRAERHFNNLDLFPNKLSEKIAEARATSIVDFYVNIVEKVSVIDESFEAYCKFGKSYQEDSTINASVLQINALLNHQLQLDTALKSTVRSYTTYVIEEGLEQEGLPLNERYAVSKDLYLKVRAQIDRSLDEKTK